MRVNDGLMKPKDRAFMGDLLVIDVELSPEEVWLPEEMPLDIIYEDDHLLLINKASNVVVHPAAGHSKGTLLNGLLYHHLPLQELPRCGIVHRLDKDTTGLMVVAKTLTAHASLVGQLQARTVTREYEAIAQGVLTGGGTVDKPLGRHPVNRKKRAIVEEGQEAITHYRVLDRFRSYTHIQVKLETGRTHQIRVHMAYLNHALLGDPLYGGRLQFPASCSQELAEFLRSFRRQALHARRLALIHPHTGEELSWEVETPQDMIELMDLLRQDMRPSQKQ